jgi:hypothetical protein
MQVLSNETADVFSLSSATEMKYRLQPEVLEDHVTVAANRQNRIMNSCFRVNAEIGF